METEDYLKISVGGRTRLFSKDVAYFEADMNYTIIHYTIGNSKIVATTLGRIQERILDKNTFVRPNRKYLINVGFINNFLQDNLLLQNQLQIHISRRRKVPVIPVVEDYLANKNE
jgi:DNA-binding LytR/AlgR family response regulator